MPFDDYQSLSDMLVWNGTTYVVNPFVSEAQHRACYAQRDPNWDCSEWEAHTPKSKKLPERKGSKKIKRQKRKAKLTRNARKPKRPRPIGSPTPAGKQLLQMDPTRTTTMRRSFCAQVNRMFARLKAHVTLMVGEKDLLGIDMPSGLSAMPVQATNCQSGQMRGADGKCGPGVGLGIPREQMPQVSGDKLEDFIRFVRSQGVGVSEETVEVEDLSPVQSHFRQERVDAIPEEKLQEPILVSWDNYILDGTHRWVKAWQLDKEATLPVLRVDLPAEESLELMRRFDGAKFAANGFDESRHQRDEHGRFTSGGGVLSGEAGESLEEKLERMRQENDKAAEKIKETKEKLAKEADLRSNERMIHHLGVKRIVTDTVEAWKYKGQVDVLDQEGPEFERGGVKWKEGGNCYLGDGHIRIHSGSAGESVDNIRHLTAHELMHGTFEHVYQQYKREQDQVNKLDIATSDRLRGEGKTGHELYHNPEYRLLANGDLKPEHAKEFPTLYRFQKLLGDNDVWLSYGRDDGITPYSEAYWRDSKDGKCTYHIAMHETLAEIAGKHEEGGVVLGSKNYRELYKAVRDEYRVLHGDQRRRKKTMGGLIANESLYQDHDLYLDADFKPTSPDKAVYLVWWKSDGTNGWATRSDPTINFNPEQERDVRGRWTSGSALLMEDSKGSDPHRPYEGPKGIPVKCGKDIERAAILLSRGYRVRLSQPQQVATLLDKMHEMVQEASAKGEAAPTFDLCKVTVKNTNLFCQESKGIPRIQMPQMRGEPVPGSYADTLPRGKKTGKVDLSSDFIQHMKDSGIGTTTTDIRASHLRASQNEIVGARVAQLVKEAEAGTRDLRKRPIFVTRDNYVVDGHHHWAAIVGYGAKKDKDFKVPVHVLDCDIGEALEKANAFAKEKGIAPKAATMAANYQAYVCNGQIGWFPAGNIIEVPDVRQRRHYDCGAACFASVMGYFGIDKDLDGWIKLLGTDVEESTHPRAIIDLATRLGFEVEARDGLTLDDLSSFLQRNMPVIVAIQDYGPYVPAKARWPYGHYVVVIGRIDGHYVVCQDPSEDNVVAGGDKKALSETDSIQNPGRILIAEDDFLKVWHDKDADGNKYIQWGCAVGRKPTANAEWDETEHPRGEGGRFVGGTAEEFHSLADQQRDKPERAMLKVQHTYGGGALNPVVEHAGDLIHRMSEKPTFRTAGYEFVKPKVDKLLDWMERKYDWKPGGSFGDEVQRSIRSNRDYLGETDAGRAMAYHTDVEDALEKYAAAHKELEPLNEAQYHANAVAIAVGEKRWGDAISHLKALKERMGSRDEWVKYAHEELRPAANVSREALDERAKQFNDLPVPITNYDPDEPRDEHGHWTSGSLLTEGLKGLKDDLTRKATDYLDKVPGARWLRETVQGLKGKMEARYGAKTAARIFFTANAISWGAFVAGPIVGYPNYIPASSLMAAGAAIAEVHYQYKTRIRPLITHSEEPDVEGLARQLVIDLATQYTERVKPTGNVNPNRDEKGRFASGTELSSEQVQEEVKKSPNIANNPALQDLRAFKRYANRFGYGEDDGPFIAGKASTDQLKRNIDSGHLRLSGTVDKSVVEKKAESDEPLNTVIIAHEPGRNMLTVDGNHSLLAAIKRGDREVHVIVDKKHASILSPTANAAEFPVATDHGKLRLFQKWIAQQLLIDITGKTQEEVWRKYIEDGYKKGAGRAFDEARPQVRAAMKHDPDSVSDFYKGTKYEFLRSSFGQPVAVEKVKLLASRTFDELKNVTADMSNKMSRILTDGLVRGEGPYQIARELTKQVDLSAQRAMVVARTELIRAHSAGQLQAYRNLGVQKLGVAVEWSDAGDDGVCERCEALQGIVLTLDEAEGLIPLHPS